jgi:hypothetical protein
MVVGPQYASPMINHLVARALPEYSDNPVTALPILY